MMVNQQVNAGIHASTGFEFQKHCALYILIEKWEEHKDKKYFISIEHHDDFLFCYKNESDLIENIKSYQAKKSSSAWGMTKNFYDILNKILEVGKNLKADKAPKIATYHQSLTFMSNSSIKIPNNIVNETNSLLKFVDIKSDIQEKIKDGITKISSDLSEIDNLTFAYIDFGKTAQSQKRDLIGLSTEVFGAKIHDHKASIDTLLNLFRDIELTANQGNDVSLMDKSKQLKSDKIAEAIAIVTTKSKAFDLWRSAKSEIGKILKIPVPLQKDFELAFENSFDLFKDLKQVEHQKIYQFVKDNKILLNDCYDDTECIDKMYELAINNKVLRQDELHLKAALFAAYLEIKDS
jgi:hypothetical protein